MPLPGDTLQTSFSAALQADKADSLRWPAEDGAEDVGGSVNAIAYPDMERLGSLVVEREPPGKIQLA